MLVVSIIIHQRLDQHEEARDVPALLQATNQKDCVALAKRYMCEAHEAHYHCEGESLVAFDNIKTYADLKAWFAKHYSYFDVSYIEADLF